MAREKDIIEDTDRRLDRKPERNDPETKTERAPSWKLMRTKNMSAPPSSEIEDETQDQQKGQDGRHSPPVHKGILRVCEWKSVGVLHRRVREHRSCERGHHGCVDSTGSLN